jgi:1-acyl-sn-glycerol-3-phosphate acyltransferase
MEYFKGGLSMLRFLYLNVFLIINSIIMCLWGLVISPFSKDGKLVHHWCAVPWAKTFLRVCGVKVNVRGLEHINKKLPYIYISNHQSYFDIFALLSGLPVDFKFLMKQELMKIPLLGIAMRKAGYMSIDREDTRNAIRSMNSAVDKVRNGASVLIFPEGTRSQDGHVRSFKKGGFHLALKSGCDIVPIAIINSRSIVPKGSLRINKGTIALNIGKPITVQDYSKKDIDILIEKARGSVIALMANTNGTETWRYNHDRIL